MIIDDGGAIILLTKCALSLLVRALFGDSVLILGSPSAQKLQSAANVGGYIMYTYVLGKPEVSDLLSIILLVDQLTIVE